MVASSSDFLELETMRKRLHEVEEALRLADKENQELVYRLEKFAKENFDIKMSQDI